MKDVSSCRRSKMDRQENITLDLLLSELVVQELVVQASMACLHNETFIWNAGIWTVADGVLGARV